VRTAKKAHECIECGRIIESGQRYNYHSGVWDGAGASYKVCLGCDLLRDQLDKGAAYDERTAFGYLDDTLASVHQGLRVTKDVLREYSDKAFAEHYG
jgi:hypothetical protein